MCKHLWGKLSAGTFWEELSALATLVQAIVVIITIVLIKDQTKLQTEQLRQQSKITRAGNIQALAAASTQLNMEEVKSSELMKFTLEGQQGFKPKVPITADEIRKEQYKTFLSTWLIFSENIYYQNSQGLIDPDMYEAWDNGLKAFLEEYNVKASWDESMKNSYHESFRNHVDQLLAQVSAQNGEPKQP